MNIAKLTESLESKLTALTSRLSSIERDVTQAHSTDSSEQAQERENDEVLDVIGNQTRHSIKQLQRALRRIEQGDYGCCANCGDDIAPSRLEAIPESTHCLPCLEKQSI